MAFRIFFESEEYDGEYWEFVSPDYKFEALDMFIRPTHLLFLDQRELTLFLHNSSASPELYNSNLSLKNRIQHTIDLPSNLAPHYLNRDLYNIRSNVKLPDNFDQFSTFDRLIFVEAHFDRVIVKERRHWPIHLRLNPLTYM